MLPPCLVAIVFLIDSSASVPDAQFALQRDGTAAAFEDRRVIAAIEASSGIAALVAEFGYGARRRLGWQLVRDRSEARAFAESLRRIGREDRSGVTAIGFAVEFARLALRTAPCDARLRVIDISTDGVESMARLPPWRARDAAHADGVEVNAILFPSNGVLAPDVDPRQALDAAARWLRSNVVTGFVRLALDNESYAPAFRAKLLTEIAMLADRDSPARGVQ